MDLQCELDTAVFIVLNLIGWGSLFFIVWRDRHHTLHHSS